MLHTVNSALRSISIEAYLTIFTIVIFSVVRMVYLDSKQRSKIQKKLNDKKENHVQ